MPRPFRRDTEHAVLGEDAVGGDAVDIRHLRDRATGVADVVDRRARVEAQPGVTYLALHCNASGDIEVIDPPRAHARTDEVALFQDPGFLSWVAAQDVALVGFREIRAACR